MRVDLNWMMMRMMLYLNDVEISLKKKTTVLNKGLLNFKKMTNLNKLTQNEGPFINTVQFHPTSTVALVAGSSGNSTIFQVDGKNNPILQILKFEKFPIRCARFSQDGNSFLVGSHKYSYYYVYDMIQGKSIRIPSHHLTGQTNMKKFELSPDGKLIAVVGKFGNIHLLNAKSKEWIDTLKINCEVMDICFTVDGLKLYSFGDNGEIYVWDMNSRLCIHRFTDEGCFKGTTIAISPNNQLLACGSGSGIVNIYQTATALENRNPQPMKTIFNLITPVSSLDFNSTSELLAMSSGDKENAAKLLHFPSLTVFKNFPVVRTSQIGLVKSQAFSPNSGFIAYGNSANSALLYRLKHFGNY
uniref:U3 small nucleolar RNA-associated protein 18 homolog n=1 Tax=Clastoptera arizonana TaxID=38151 RepID=A0A1B6DTA7_9HEMI